MKFSTVFTTLLASIVSVVSAASFADVKGAQGAVYFLSNEPSGNKVFAAEISSNGKLKIKRAIDAGGVGAHGINPPTGPDALFSAVPIKASSKRDFVVAVNAGSNTISLFKINPANPTNLEMVGKPVASGGEFPISVTINNSADRACTLNGGAVGGVSCFKVDLVKGLIPIPGALRGLPLNQTTPPSGPPRSAGQVLFTEDNKQIVVSVKGDPPTPGYLAVWDVAANGSLSTTYKTIPVPHGSLVPLSINLIPGSNAVLATDPAIGFAVVDLEDASKSSAVMIPGQRATCWASYSSKTKNFYLVDLATATVTEVHIGHDLKATLVKVFDLQLYNLWNEIDRELFF
ncbi:hypothetical protein H0H81_009608 [Sphagnurus paluster]|uniref:3-carboxymuconate cyclase n=1 Tax=Sphagnurus paluster TaxID=117069 RepID=A0A9P7FUI0_9AGAR|nr:hypothetical protein H0H81_009608 [Sphagnurus paluster]